MSDVGSMVALLSGVMLLKLRLSGAYTVYVRPGMGVLLLVSGAVLTAVGAAGLALAFWGRAGSGGTDPGTGDHDVHAGHGNGDGDDACGDHGRLHVPRAALLLVLPILAVFLVEPTPLGSFAAGRQSPWRPAPPPPERAGGSLYDPLPPPRDGAADLTVSQYVSRALYDPERSLGDAPVRLVGLAAPDRDGPPGSFRLVRFQIACCAADAYPVQVEVVGAGQVPERDSWVEVVGVLAPGTIDGLIPRLSARSVSPTATPSQPYET